MANIKEWIRQQLRAGFSKEAIKQALVNGGHNPNLLEEVINEINRKKLTAKTRTNKPHSKLIIAFGFLVISAISVYFIYYQSISGLVSNRNFKAEDVVFVSYSDLEFQDRVKNITGYDWIAFLNADGSDNSKIAALLFLSNEIDELDDNFDFVNRSVGISKGELPDKLDATDNSRDNLLKLIGNVKSVDNVFFSKGLETAKTRANRLSVIGDFFKRYTLLEGEINIDVKDIFAEILGLTVDDYSRLVSLMVVNYNLFLAE